MSTRTDSVVFIFIFPLARQRLQSTNRNIQERKLIVLLPLPVHCRSASYEIQRRTRRTRRTRTHGEMRDVTRHCSMVSYTVIGQGEATLEMFTLSEKKNDKVGLLNDNK